MGDSGYAEFLRRKSQVTNDCGFKPVFMPDYLFDFQKALVEWAIKKGRAAIFADCGLGKTPIQLVWAENIVRKTGKNVLIVAPLAVSHQTVREGDKFGVVVDKSGEGKAFDGITITNYERLHYFNSNDFVGVICDESSAIKSFHGKRRALVTEFMRKLPYRLLATATAAPNDYVELGTSSEALGELDRTDMMNRFFKNDERTTIQAHAKWTGQDGGGGMVGWRLKGHAELPFWRWVSSWARALRKPSDLGFADDKFILPPLKEINHTITSDNPRKGMLFPLTAKGLAEEREEAMMTINERCEKVAKLVGNKKTPSIIWCHYNPEGELLAKKIPDAIEISGSDSDEKKVKAFLDFKNGDIRVLITKPKIGAWGLNWQHCNHVVYFPSHSYEQYYQAIRRCWRFGQTKPVTVNVIATKSGMNVIKSLQHKADMADTMFKNLVKEMNSALNLDRKTYKSHNWEVPLWLNK